MNKLMISAALTGTGGSKALSPYVPVTPQEIAADAVACAKAGASMVHLHVKDENGNASMQARYFKAAFEAIKEATDKEGIDVIVNFTSAGGSKDTVERLEPLELCRPEMCSYDSGTFNWALGGIFENSPDFLVKLGMKAQELDIKPEIEVFDYAMIANAIEYAKHGVLKTPMHFQFVLGVVGAMPGTTEFISFLKNKLPEGSTWSATGIGQAHLPILLAALSMGCDGVRVGLEDNLYLSRGVKATNAQLVERAVAIAKLAGREIATPDETRAALGITRHALKEYQPK